jgi:hypothetical protein
MNKPPEKTEYTVTTCYVHLRGCCSCKRFSELSEAQKYAKQQQKELPAGITEIMTDGDFVLERNEWDNMRFRSVRK